MLFDLVNVDKRYVNNDFFVAARKVDKPFQASPIDKEIMKDKSYYRVADFTKNIMADGTTSYFHNSIGGYHAAKPKRYQELYDFQISKGNGQVLNMLNTKYIIGANEKGEIGYELNAGANGNAWFVEKIKFVNSANEEMKALDSLDNKNEVVMNERNYVDYFKGTKFNGIFKKDSLASIQLVSFKPNHLKYISNNSKNGFAVFSEMYYKNGWKATIDGKDARIHNVNYVLRGLQIPAGKHTIEFKFEPEVIKTGSTIALMSSIGMLLLIGAGVYFERKKKV